jgi:hypothetical protein
MERRQVESMRRIEIKENKWRKGGRNRGEETKRKQMTRELK